MHAVAAEAVQVNREGGSKGLTFTGRHFGDGAFVEHEATDHLHVEVTQAQHAVGCLSHRCECLGHELVDVLALLQAFAQLARLPTKLIIVKLLDFGFELVGLVSHPLELAKLSAFTHTQDLVQNCHVLLLGLASCPGVAAPVPWFTQTYFIIRARQENTYEIAISAILHDAFA